MADGIEFSNGMVYDAHVPGIARFMYDPDPGNPVSEPKTVNLDDLIATVKKNAPLVPVHMVNRVRGGFNIDTHGCKVKVTAGAFIVYLKEDATTETFTVAAGDRSWHPSWPDDPAQREDTLFCIIVDLDHESHTAQLFVVSGDYIHDYIDGEFTKPVCIGAFYYSKSYTPAGIQGLHICNDDVLVDGHYIYDTEYASGYLTREGFFCGQVRGAMNIDSSNKSISVSDAFVYVSMSSGIYGLTAQSASWNKGGSLNYEGYYNVFAEVDIPGDNNRIRAVRMGAMYIPSGKIIDLGYFYYNGSSVTGISFKNDVYVDGAYIYGSGGGGVPEAPTDGRMYGRKNSGWAVVQQGPSIPAARLTATSNNIIDIRTNTAPRKLVLLNPNSYVSINNGAVYSLYDFSSSDWIIQEFSPVFFIYADVIDASHPDNRLVIANSSAAFLPVGTLYMLGTFMYSSDYGIKGLSINSALPMVNGVKWTDN
jgi:hypothetical protein